MHCLSLSLRKPHHQVQHGHTDSYLVVSSPVAYRNSPVASRKQTGWTWGNMALALERSRSKNPSGQRNYNNAISKFEPLCLKTARRVHSTIFNVPICYTTCYYISWVNSTAHNHGSCLHIVHIYAACHEQTMWGLKWFSSEVLLVNSKLQCLVRHSNDVANCWIWIHHTLQPRLFVPLCPHIIWQVRCPFFEFIHVKITFVLGDLAPRPKGFLLASKSVDVCFLLCWLKVDGRLQIVPKIYQTYMEARTTAPLPSVVEQLGQGEG